MGSSIRQPFRSAIFCMLNHILVTKIIVFIQISDKFRKVEKRLECPICLEYVENAVDCNGCHILYCESCSKTLQRCEVCRKEHVNFHPNHFARQMVGDMETDCPNGKCEETPTRANLQEHLKKCPFQVVKCFQENCTVEFERNMQDMHKEECLFVEMICQNAGCHNKMIRKHADNHKVECLYGEVKCDNLGCDAVILRKDIKSHVSVTCKFRMVSCPVDGCFFSDAGGVVGHHIVDNHYDFFASKMFPGARVPIPSPRRRLQDLYVDNVIHTADLYE